MAEVRSPIVQVHFATLGGEVRTVEVRNDATISDLLAACGAEACDALVFGKQPLRNLTSSVAAAGLRDGSTVQLVRPLLRREIMELEAKIAGLPSAGEDCQKYLRYLDGVPSGHPSILARLKLVSLLSSDVPVAELPAPRFFQRGGPEAQREEVQESLVPTDEVAAAAIVTLAYCSNVDLCEAECESECAAAAAFVSGPGGIVGADAPDGLRFRREARAEKLGADDLFSIIQTRGLGCLLQSLDPHHDVSRYHCLLTWIVSPGDSAGDVGDGGGTEVARLKLVLAECQNLISNGDGPDFPYQMPAKVQGRQLDSYIQLLKMVAGDPMQSVEDWVQ